MKHDALLEEWAAWCALATLAETGDRYTMKGIMYVEGGSGLCPMIDELIFQGVVQEIRWAMKRRLPRRRYGKLRNHSWHHNAEGWKRRAAFCWRMAEECEKEMNRCAMTS